MPQEQVEEALLTAVLVLVARCTAGARAAGISDRQRPHQCCLAHLFVRWRSLAHKARMVIGQLVHCTAIRVAAARWLRRWAAVGSSSTACYPQASPGASDALSHFSCPCESFRQYHSRQRAKHSQL